MQPAEGEVRNVAEGGDRLSESVAIAFRADVPRQRDAAEILVDGDSWRVIRRRQTIDDLLALEG